MRPPKSIDLTGQRFGSLTAVSWAGRTERYFALWLCICDCGRLTAIPYGNLAYGNTKSCGCQTRQMKGVDVRLLPVPSLIPRAIQNLTDEYRRIESELYEKYPQCEDENEETPEDALRYYSAMEEIDGVFWETSEQYGMPWPPIAERRAERAKKQEKEQ